MTIKPATIMRPGSARRADRPDPPQEKFSTDTYIGGRKFTAPAIKKLEEATKAPAPAASVAAITVGTGRSDTLQVGTDGEKLDSSWERAGLPSDFAFYEWSEMSVKRFGVRDHAKLSRAVRYKSMTLLLDVLSSTCNRDARQLAYPDFQALCLWHKLWSYPSSQYTISWASKYGVRGSSKIKATRVKETKLGKTRPEYLEWKAKGYAVSTAADVELLDSKTLEEEDILIFDKAQFIDLEPLKAQVEVLAKAGDRAPTATARINELEKRGIKSFDEIDEFASLYSEFGVQEFASVVLADNLFDPKVAVENLRRMGEPGMASDEADVRKLALELLVEADQIEAAMERGEKYAPKTEEVPLVFNPWGMFPHT
jgi:hypothetical protein